MVETPAARKLESDAAAGEWIVVESASNATDAARAATSRMIDLLADRWGFSPVHAYLLCSVAMNLRLSQVVNEPIFTVSAAISKDILPVKKLF
jgi:acetamidase/formamidase